MEVSRSIPACAGEPMSDSHMRLLVWVYPRVCGGTSSFTIEDGTVNGLSPRVRGNPRARSVGRLAQGSIPACAGEPARRGSSASSRAVYPRVCGGTPCPAHGGERPNGLSPRVRGNPLRLWLRGLSLRSIPACAGEPAPRAPPGLRTSVYPRVCGGTSTCVWPVCANSGLSPRVRGNRQRMGSVVARQGSIPACAGEPCSSWPVAALATVYPRVCGGTTSTSCAIAP